MEFIKYIANLLNQDNNPTEYHKKTDEYIETVAEDGGNGDLSIPFASANETDRIQEFAQDTCDYYTGALGGRPLKYVNDLKCGMARIGDGISTPLFWCMSLRHPVGFMLNENGIDPLRVVDLERYGLDKLLVYADSDVKACVDSIAVLLEDHRSIRLQESDEEKENHTKAPPTSVEISNNNNNGPPIKKD
jgi:hypothetical protein